MFNGNKRYVNMLIQDTLKAFIPILDENSWTDTKKFDNFREDIILDKAKDFWDKACKEGIGPNLPIDPDALGVDNFDMVVVNFIGKLLEQEWLSNIVWEYLRTLKYIEVLHS